MTRPAARKTTADANHKALELVMRDVLAGLEELATLAGYEAAPGSFEILSIERPATSPHSRIRTVLTRTVHLTGAAFRYPFDSSPARTKDRHPPRNRRQTLHKTTRGVAGRMGTSSARLRSHAI